MSSVCDQEDESDDEYDQEIYEAPQLRANIKRLEPASEFNEEEEEEEEESLP